MKKISVEFKTILIVTASIFVLMMVLLYQKNVEMELQRQGVIYTSFIKGKPIILDKRVEDNHGSYMGAHQLYEPELIEIIYTELQKRLVQKKPVILLDIGANTGSFALLPVMSDQIKVFAFEPNLEVADILRANVNLNNIAESVTIMPIGISNKTSIIDLHIPRGKSTGLATFGASVLRFDAEAGNSSAALTMSLDDLMGLLLKNGESIDVVKIDTEGWEYYVLLGATKTLQIHKPVILLEFNDINMRQAGVVPKNVLNLLSTLNYDCKLLVEDLLCHPS